MYIRRLVVALAIVAVPVRATERDAIILRSTDPVETLFAATNFAASGHRGVFLLDTPAAVAANQRYLDEFKPARVTTVDTAEEIRHLLFPNVLGVVVPPCADRRQLLAAAGQAVAARRPLYSRKLGDRSPTNERETTVSASRESVETLVLVNPSDNGVSSLAPLVAARHRGVVLTTHDAGTDGTAVVKAALARPEYSKVDNLIILARPESVRGETRANPAAGKDAVIDMEPFTPTGREPFTLATGRLFHADPGIVALMLARARLLPSAGSRRTALVASNPGGSLEMLEALSRTSARELAACGYETTGLYGDQLGPSGVRRRLPGCDLFLWEGHHNTLMKDWRFADWHEPLRPSVIVLQSCLALNETKTGQLFERGALAVVGTSSRTYSASGGAFSLAYLDALAYDGRTLGGALRQAKNFLLAYSHLKAKRLGATTLSGANVRAAWAFSLWGDPTLMLPSPNAPPVDAVACRVEGDAFFLHVPAETKDAPGGGKYRVPYRPNTRLAGLVKAGGEDVKELVALVFAEVALPHAPRCAEPTLHTKLADTSWAFLWDGRRRVGYLIAVPKSGAHELKFRVEWHAAVRGDVAVERR